MHTRKNRSATLSLCLGLAVLLGLLGAQPAGAVPTAPSITLAPKSGFPGSEILVGGSGFAWSPTGATAVDLYWEDVGGQSIGSAMINQDGTFTTTATIPLQTTRGEHDIIAYSVLQEQATAIFDAIVAATSVDTLILVDYERMEDIGYSSADVSTLESKINTLVGMPKSQSNMQAVIRHLNLAAGLLAEARSAWNGNEDSVSATNNYVGYIDATIENLKQGIYPNLQYIIIVGAHEVIPMKARPADDMSSHPESSWGNGLPAGNPPDYFRSLYSDTSGGATLGHYLTDSVYGDLSYVNNGYGVDNELIPELAVGRPVETPSQISTLVQNYMDSNATLSKNDLASIASNDYMDGGQAAANSMGSSADTSLIQSSFSSSLIPPVINANGDIVYLAGHGNYNYIAPGFRAGSSTGGDTEDLSNMPDAVIAASGCHNGVNFGNMLYHDYTGNTTYGEFPERFAFREVGVYLGSTGYTWISGTGSSTNAAHTGWSEKLATHFLDHLLNDGMSITAGKAYKAAVNEYVSDYGGIGDPHRRVLAIATLYGIPNYRWPTWYVVVYRWPRAYWIQRLIVIPPVTIPRPMNATAAITATETITLEIRDWSVDPDGLINIPGASYTGDYDEPILPVINANRVLPLDSNITEIVWNQGESISETISNDVPLASMAVLTTPITNTFSYTETFYPATLLYTSTLTALGGGAVEVGLSIVPVQYRQSTHQTRVWTRTVFEIEYEIDEDALIADSDSDTLPNFWESGYGLDPNDDSGDQGASGDPDEDELTNSQERDLFTNPMDPDTDHDGRNDGQEIADGTDPLNPGSRLFNLYLPQMMRDYS
jgi:hypothetical protein